MIEKWGSIKDFEGLYEVSNTGFVKSLQRKRNHFKGGIVTERLLSPAKNKDGYLCVVFYSINMKKTMSVHRLVAVAFVSNPENKPEVNHKDGIKIHNEDYNLEWVTPKENTRHAIKSLGIVKGVKGEANGKAKLCDNDIIEIRELLRGRMFTQQQIADKFGVSQHAIWSIKERKVWSHI